MEFRHSVAGVAPGKGRNCAVAAGEHVIALKNIRFCIGAQGIRLIASGWASLFHPPPLATVAAELLQIWVKVSKMVFRTGLTGNCFNCSLVYLNLWFSASNTQWPEFEIVSEDECTIDAEESEPNDQATCIVSKDRDDFKSLLDNFEVKFYKSMIMLPNAQFSSASFESAMQGNDDKKRWASFQERIGRAPEQVLRYCRDVKAKPLWPMSSGQPSKADIPSCSYCNGPLSYELQELNALEQRENRQFLQRFTVQIALLLFKPTHGQRRRRAMNAPDRYERFVVPEGVKKVSYERDTKIINAASFTVEREDHTIGNILRMQLHRDPNVLFAGYKLPHPLQYKIIVRIHTTSQSSPMQAYDQAIKDLDKELDHLKSAFEFF
ncbi:hypothetical protein ACLOJK_017742 [Asimina triloba]